MISFWYILYTLLETEERRLLQPCNPPTIGGVVCVCIHCVRIAFVLHTLLLASLRTSASAPRVALTLVSPPCAAGWVYVVLVCACDLHKHDVPLFRFLGYFLPGDFVVRLFGEPVVYIFLLPYCVHPTWTRPCWIRRVERYPIPSVSVATLFVCIRVRRLRVSRASFALSPRCTATTLANFSRITGSACSYVCITARRLRFYHVSSF